MTDLVPNNEKDNIKQQINDVNILNPTIQWGNHIVITKHKPFHATIHNDDNNEDAKAYLNTLYCKLTSKSVEDVSIPTLTQMIQNH